MEDSLDDTVLRALADIKMVKRAPKQRHQHSFQQISKYERSQVSVQAHRGKQSEYSRYYSRTRPTGTTMHETIDESPRKRDQRAHSTYHSRARPTVTTVLETIDESPRKREQSAHSTYYSHARPTGTTKIKKTVELLQEAIEEGEDLLRGMRDRMQQRNTKVPGARQHQGDARPTVTTVLETIDESPRKREQSAHSTYYSHARPTGTTKIKKTGELLQEAIDERQYLLRGMLDRIQQRNTKDPGARQHQGVSLSKSSHARQPSSDSLRTSGSPTLPFAANYRELCNLSTSLRDNAIVFGFPLCHTLRVNLSSHLIARLAKCIGKSWDQFAMECLGFSHIDIEHIQHDNRYLASQISTMLHQFKQRNPENANLGFLLQNIIDSDLDCDKHKIRKIVQKELEVQMPQLATTDDRAKTHVRNTLL